MIEEISAFRTQDGRTFATREDAEQHEMHMQIEARIKAYSDDYLANDTVRAKSRAEAAIRRFLRWESGQGEAT